MVSLLINDNYHNKYLVVNSTQYYYLLFINQYTNTEFKKNSGEKRHTNIIIFIHDSSFTGQINGVAKILVTNTLEQNSKPCRCKPFVENLLKCGLSPSSS